MSDHEKFMHGLHELRNRTGKDYINAKQKRFDKDAVRLAVRYDTLTEVLRLADNVYGEYFGSYPEERRHNDGTLCQGLDH
jgi:hypothetical protein